MADDDQRGRERDRRPRPPGEQPVADVAGHRAPDPRPPGPPATGSRPADEHDAEHRRDERDRDQRHRRAHGRRQREEDDDGEDGLHDLPGGALPRDGPQTAADVAHVATVADAAVDVADDPAGQRDVEEQRPVVRRHRSGQRQVDAEATGDDLPPPGTAHGRQHRDACRCRQRPAVDRADAVEERARAQVPDQDGERRGGAHEARPRPHGPAHAAPDLLEVLRRVAPAHAERLRPRYVREGRFRGRRRHGRTSRSAWSTVTASCPARCLRQTSACVGGGLGGQLDLLLARGTDPPGEPLRRQVGLGGAEPPGAGPDEDLGPQPAEPLDGGRDGVRAEQAAASPSCGAGGRRMRPPRGRRADPPGVRSTRPTTDRVSSTGTPGAGADGRPARPARRRSAGRAAPRR